MTDKKASYRMGWFIEEATESGEALTDGNKWSMCTTTTGDPSDLEQNAKAIQVSLGRHATLLARDLLIRSSDTPEVREKKTLSARVALNSP